MWIPSNHLPKQAVGDKKEWTEKGQQIHSTGGVRSCKDSVSQALFRNTEKYSALSALIPCKRIDLAALKRKSPGIRPGSFVFCVWRHFEKNRILRSIHLKKLCTYTYEYHAFYTPWWMPNNPPLPTKLSLQMSWSYLFVSSILIFIVRYYFK